MPEPKRTFGPVVLVGLAASGLAAVAGTKPWVSGSSDRVSTDNLAYATTIDAAGVRESPLAAALALVALACWGVLLVTRGRVRRAIALLAALASFGTLVTGALAFTGLQDGLADALRDLSGADTSSVSMTPWFPAALVGAVLATLASLAAVRFAPHWPEMGRRYDAPAAAAEAEPEGNLDIWKALDEGHDPTAGRGPLD